MHSLAGYLETSSKEGVNVTESFEFIANLMWNRITGADPSHIIKEKGLVQIDDSSEIEKIAKKIISANQKPVEDYKKGKEAALQFLVGQFMKETKGKVNPQKAGEILKKLIS